MLASWRESVTVKLGQLRKFAKNLRKGESFSDDRESEIMWTARRSDSTEAEEALAALLDGGGASGLCKLGLAIRNDAARRRVDAALFRNQERMRVLRRSSSMNVG